MRLRELRKDCGLTQQKVGEVLGMSQSTYQTYENNRAVPTLDNLIKLADFYNVSLDYLCNRVYRDEIGYLDKRSKEILQVITNLSDANKEKVYYFVKGLFEGQ